MTSTDFLTRTLPAACIAALCLGLPAGDARAQATIDFNKEPVNVVNFNADGAQFHCFGNDEDLECSGNGEANLSGPAPDPGTDGDNGDGEGEGPE